MCDTQLQLVTRDNGGRRRHGLADPHALQGHGVVQHADNPVRDDETAVASQTVHGGDGYGQRRRGCYVVLRQPAAGCEAIHAVRGASEHVVHGAEEEPHPPLERPAGRDERERRALGAPEEGCRLSNSARDNRDVSVRMLRSRAIHQLEAVRARERRMEEHLLRETMARGSARG